IREAMGNPALRTVLISATLVHMGMTTLQPVLSLQVAKLGQEGKAALSAGLIYSIAGIATVIGAPLWARRGQALGFKRVLVANLMAAGVFNIPLAFVKSIYLFGALRFAVGLSSAGIGLSMNALTSKSVNVEFRGRAFGILQSFNQIGGMFGPMLGGIMGTVVGLESTFALAAGVYMATSVLVARFLRSEEPVLARARA
ncbi:MAG: MFS transporter, partial [Bacillota bacterium]|nr:MFS transporter [Bacillota bacterium]